MVLTPEEIAPYPRAWQMENPVMNE